MSRTDSFPDLADGDVVYVDYLHFDTAVRLTKTSIKRDHSLYEVEGKARPALIFGEHFQKNGLKWHRIYALTTKGVDEKGNTKKRYIRLDGLINPGQTSYIYCIPESYPENLVSTEDGQRRVIKQLNPLELANVTTMIRAQAQGIVESPKQA
ncbi:MAG TPA: hypothetical protein VHU84_02950 [Lacipirellulaceae bacterium]|jgi:hypothetical protein|nr:hypothetical protein [Lacipirellulaceae bacterium]